MPISRAPQRMLRLLQGDVGSGKTVVALLAAAAVIESGGQAALMAPTEILARQHHKTIAPLAAAAGLRIAILTGRERGRERTGVLDRLAAGEIDLLVGTHALFQDEVGLSRSCARHRRRAAPLRRRTSAWRSPRKGEAVDVLVMTATPIPRTLVLTAFGDMDVSELKEKPAGRLPIDTRTIPLDRLDEVMAAVGRALSEGRRIYWVCPLVEESETSDLAAAEERFAALEASFGDAVDLVHGRMKGADKDAAMARFAAGETRILVATTVIEVGVDVPEATVMIIEHAERFGLSQLHQLRGRDRARQRTTRPASCSTARRSARPPRRGSPSCARPRTAFASPRRICACAAAATCSARARAAPRASASPSFPCTASSLRTARDDAALILARDPMLAGERGKALRTLLYLFERDEAVRLLGAG